MIWHGGKEGAKNTYCHMTWKNTEGRDKQGRDKEHLLFWHRNEMETVCDFSFCITNPPPMEWIYTFLTLLWHRNVRHRRLKAKEMRIHLLKRAILFEQASYILWSDTFFDLLLIRSCRDLWCQHACMASTRIFICHFSLLMPKTPYAWMNIYLHNTVVTQKRVPQRALCHFSLLMPKTSHARNEHILS